MLFNSYSFIVFLALTIIISRILNNWTIRKLFLLIVSYLFYAAWSPPFILLLLISTLSSWYAGKVVCNHAGSSRRIIFLVLCLILNCGILAYFKYGNFIIENINSSLKYNGLELQLIERNIIIPIGISFYTFQTFSYIIDVYRGHLKSWDSLLDYMLYVTFFPQLVAGPITRASYFLPQCKSSRMGDNNQIGWGLSLFVIGLFTKVFIADELAAPIVQTVYDSKLPVTFISSWAGTFAFTVQIFCDFFGYSTCAIGIALTLGFKLPENFLFPYAAKGFSDFWRRWHISLSTWLRDYLYISMGGNRRGSTRTYVNLGITMLLGGLWHGASWMFVIWGGLHGFYLIVERKIHQTDICNWFFWKTRFGEIVIIIFTFLIVSFTWVFFRADDIHKAFSIAFSMLNIMGAWATLSSSFNYAIPFGESVASGLTNLEYITVLCITIFICLSHFFLRHSSLEKFFFNMPWWMRSFLLGGMVLLTLTCMAGEDRAFIYFQF